MKIEIEIPKEFEEHFNQDKFKDSLERIMADIKHSLENGDCLCAGSYEYETIEMLEKAFENSRQVYSVDKVVGELEKKSYTTTDTVCGGIFEAIRLSSAIKIVKQGGVSDDVCKWKYANNGEFIRNPHTRRTFSNEPSMQNVYCNTCGKKIKVVE